MQQHRIISLASILAMLLIPVIGWFLVAQPQLAAASQADEARIDTEAQIAASTQVVNQLKADSAKLPELNADLNDLRTSIPADADADGYIDGLDALAKLAHVQITGLTVAEAMQYIAAVPPVDPNAVAPDANAAPDPSATPTPAPVVETPGIITSPLIDSSNFVAIPVTVEVTGTGAQIMKFVQGLQSSPRLFLVTSLGTTESASSSDLTAKIGGFIWAIPTGVEGKPRPISTTVKQLDPIVPATPDPTSTATPDPTPSGTAAP
ncbi:MAG: hypothetical protein JWP32_1178 [Schumannella sp.]|nr:hypothetical protein [Schumannella sp.]